jgi:hypothetical protein
MAPPLPFISSETWHTQRKRADLTPQDDGRPSPQERLSHIGNRFSTVRWHEGYTGRIAKKSGEDTW